MKNLVKSYVACFMIAFMMVMLGTTMAYAKSKAQIISDMKARLDTINQLKDAGAVGETANGYIAFVKGDNGSGDVVAAENSDRKALYAIIAKEQNTSADVVGNNMGVLKAQRVKPGHYFRDASGAWMKK